MSPALQSVVDDAATHPYWQAAAQGKLLIKRCKECSQVHFYPRALCPHCLGDTEWVESRGVGRVYSASTVQQADGNYVIAYVELDEGVTMLTNLIDAGDGVAIGARVRLSMQPAANELAIPMFSLDKGA
ncbi:Zn-ribbon domain-containing OB-fold protein [Variovorax sp. efr-133-TYG-130]|uniref:Zn-ribbon domain-containing OB-fold protein n=1 Tax=Variovorax sp. efr-133-TYG-130 TaxID=3040327 RepID=UPI00255262A8|nr:Zn-ribbon domain-containing OB-fold protein [Variovorax sp. efr-133-TYG-130]